MASSIWGGLAALGDAGVAIGGSMLKSQLADKLEQQREVRADERQRAKEAREALKPTGSRVYQDDQGATWRVGVNTAGDPVTEPVLASPYEIKDYNQQEEDRKRKLALDDLDLWLKEQQVADYGEDKELKREYTREQIANMRDSRARGWASLAARGSGKSENEPAEPTPYDYIDDLRTKGKPLIEAYGDAIPKSDVEGILKQAVQEAAKYRMDTRSTLEELLYSKYGVPGSPLRSAIPKKKKVQR